MTMMMTVPDESPNWLWPRAEDRLHFCPPGRVLASLGVRRELAPLLQRLGLRHGVLVTDAFFAEHTPWVREQVEAAAAGGRLQVYAGGLPDPSVDLCDEALLALPPRVRALVAALDLPTDLRAMGLSPLPPPATPACAAPARRRHRRAAAPA